MSAFFAKIPKDYEWINFFHELSNKFLKFEKSQDKLIDLLKFSGIENGFEDQNIKGEKSSLEEIDPFTAWSLILKHGDEKKIKYLSNLKDLMSLETEVPASFRGVPSVHAQQAWYFPYAYERKSEHIPLLWEIFKQAMSGDVDSEVFDNLLQLKIIGVAKLTSGLFLANPHIFLPINLQTRPFLEKNDINPSIKNYLDYENILDKVSERFFNKNIYEISFESWVGSADSTDDEIIENDEIENLWSTSTLLDNDAETTEDLLNRKEFASYLVGEINDLQDRTIQGDEDKSSIFNIYGAWGSGKSTFVKMLKESLKESSKSNENLPQEWLTVDFNAWRNQHIKPVWWSLLDHVTTQLNNQESSFLKRQWLKLKELGWRVKAAYGFWFVVPIAFLSFLLISGADLDLNKWELVGGVLTTAISILGFSVIAMQAIFSGAGVAKLFQTLNRDPYHYVIRHYKKTLNSHKNKSVFIFIDDLDRCSATYVVELLECLHTFFSAKQVFFMVAADRTWVSGCFEEIYDGKGGSASEVGRPRGYLFLEKIFQVSIGLPAITGAIKDRFVSGLLGENEKKPVMPFSSLRNETILNYLQEATTEDELSKKGQELTGQGYSAEDVMDISTKISGSKAFSESRQHRLTRFLPLMDANPRNIKLLINVYGIYINLFRMGGRVELTSEVLDQIALWSILNIRFPRLAEFIETDIYALDVIDEYYEKPNIPEVLTSLPEDIQVIVKNSDVRRVVAGDYIPTENNKSVISGINKTTLGALIGVEEIVF